MAGHRMDKKAGIGKGDVASGVTRAQSLNLVLGDPHWSDKAQIECQQQATGGNGCLLRFRILILSSVECLCDLLKYIVMFDHPAVFYRVHTYPYIRMYISGITNLTRICSHSNLNYPQNQWVF